METTGLPTFLGNPPCICSALRPRPDQHRLAISAAPTRPSLSWRRRLQKMVSFEAGSHSFCTSCLRFAGFVTALDARLAPAAGSALPGGIQTHGFR